MTTNSMKLESADPVNQPQHYLVSTIHLQPIELTARLDSCLGQALQYIIRAPYKDSELEDLRKADFYLNKWLEINKTDYRVTPETAAYIRVFMKHFPSSFAQDILWTLFNDFNGWITRNNVNAAVLALEDEIEHFK